MKKPCWDDGNIDEGIKPLVEALNLLPDVETVESCEGHGKKAIVYFRFNDNTMPPWLARIMMAATRVDTCLGCYHFRILFNSHFDCGHKLTQYWTIECDDRPQTQAIFGEVIKEIQQIASEAKVGIR